MIVFGTAVQSTGAAPLQSIAAPPFAAVAAVRVALQSGDLSSLQLALGVGEILTVVLGLAISYIALQGYRRNDSRAMLFVGAGFALVVGVPSVAAILYLAVPGVSEVHAGIVTQISEVAGMASILYGLRQ